LTLAIAAGLCAADFEWSLPKGFPRPAVPSSNRMSAAEVELGRHLFYDKRMSRNGKQSCATCHRQELAFTDGRAHAEGTTGQAHPRSSMSLVNVAYAPSLTWANPALDSLEDQALVPMLGEEPVELGLKGHEQEFLDVLQRDSVYRRLFSSAFPGTAVYTLANVTRAIAAFERTIVSMNSPYDRYRWDGDSPAISDSAKRGEILFSSSERGGCFQCHGGWNFTAVRFEGTQDRTGDGGPRGVFSIPAHPYTPRPTAVSMSGLSAPKTSESSGRPRFATSLLPLRTCTMEASPHSKRYWTTMLPAASSITPTRRVSSNLSA
jgi:cytochrome c peroxidase